MVRKIEEKIKDFQLMFSRKLILDSLYGLQSNLSNMDKLVRELKKCDFSLYGEYFGKVKIFQCQSNENLFETLIKKELQEACCHLHVRIPSTENMMKPSGRGGKKVGV